MLSRRPTADDILLRHRQNSPQPLVAAPRLRITNLAPRDAPVASEDALSLSGNALRNLQRKVSQFGPACPNDSSALLSAFSAPTPSLPAAAANQSGALSRQRSFLAQQQSPLLTSRLSSAVQQDPLLDRQGSASSQQDDALSWQRSAFQQTSEFQYRQVSGPTPFRGSPTRQGSTSLQRTGSLTNQHADPVIRQASALPQPTGFAISRSPVLEQLPLSPVSLSHRLAASSRQASRNTSVTTAVGPHASLVRAATQSPSLAELQLSGLGSLTPTVSNVTSCSISRDNRSGDCIASGGVATDSTCTEVIRQDLDTQSDGEALMQPKLLGVPVTARRLPSMATRADVGSTDLFASAKALQISAYKGLVL